MTVLAFRGSEPGCSLAPTARNTTQGYAAPVAFVTDGHTQVHLATKDFGVAFRTHIVNPLDRQHRHGRP